ncbi:caspase family protein [Candidatus Palauibacter sp.]|uniref:caspase family protein n=1 Tax=Candidatus Palauibacter sp. TaxID=3101350 RepID=UPI003B01CBD3
MLAAAAEPEIVSVGTYSGSLTETDPRLADGQFYDEWWYEGLAGERLGISATSEAFDTYLMAYRADLASDLAFLGDDDDGGSGTSSALTVQLHADGPYAIVVSSYASGELGPYQLMIEPRRPAIVAGSARDFELVSTHDTLGDGTHYRTWDYYGEAGEQLTVSMDSKDFDAYLILGRGRVGSNFEWLEEDDDGGLDTNARLSLSLPEDGLYTIVANSDTPAVGTFTLQVEHELPAAPSPFAGTGDPSDRYALLVGINDYPGRAADLRGPLGDVAIMHDILVRNYGFLTENILVLRDNQATRDNIIRAFASHLGQAGPDGVAAFFFSGHGREGGENIGVLDLEVNGVDESLVVWGPGEYTSLILDDEVGFLLDGLEAERILVVIDACYSGTSTMSGGPIQAKEASDSDLSNLRLPRSLAGKFNESSLRAGADGADDLLPGLIAVRRPERHVLMAAAREDEKAWTAGRLPGRDQEVSVFTHYLAVAIDQLGPAATFDQIRTTVSDSVEYFLYLKDRPRQTPQLTASAPDQSIAAFLRRR